VIVFDASAMIAYLRGEAGGEMVRDFLDDADVEKYAHSINLAEVFISFARSHSEPTAREALDALRAAGIEERCDMDAALWRDAAALVAQQRRNGHGLSLGDSFCIALARRLSAELVTGDYPEFEPIQTANLARVTFFR
jgi:ribonuclease VapC